MRRVLKVELVAAVVVVLGSAGCAELTTGPGSATMSEALSPDGLKLSASSASSTLCAAYERERSSARSDLSLAPKDAVLQATLAAYDAVIADACS